MRIVATCTLMITFLLPLLLSVTLGDKGDFNYPKTDRKLINKVSVFGRLSLPENRMETGMLNNPEARLTDFSPALP